jgi:hypothetical protein
MLASHDHGPAAEIFPQPYLALFQVVPMRPHPYWRKGQALLFRRLPVDSLTPSSAQSCCLFSAAMPSPANYFCKVTP